MALLSYLTVTIFVGLVGSLFAEESPESCRSSQPTSASFILHDGTSQPDFESMKSHATSVIGNALAEGSHVTICALENKNVIRIVETVLNGKEKTWRDDLNLFSHRRTSNVDREHLDIKVVEKFINNTMDTDERRKMAQILFIYSASDVKNVKRLPKKTFVFVKAESDGWKDVATDSQHIHVGGWNNGVEETDLLVICKDSHYMCDIDGFRLANSKKCHSCSSVCGLKTSKDAEYCRLICPYYNPYNTTTATQQKREGIDKRNILILTFIGLAIVAVILILCACFYCKKVRARPDSAAVQEEIQDEEAGTEMQPLQAGGDGQQEMMTVMEVAETVQALEEPMVNLREGGRLQG